MVIASLEFYSPTDHNDVGERGKERLANYSAQRHPRIKQTGAAEEISTCRRNCAIRGISPAR
jgi:hypothetical protein